MYKRQIHDLALHYDDVLDALELESATLVGHSFGAMIAAEVAALPAGSPPPAGSIDGRCRIT